MKWSEAVTLKFVKLYLKHEILWNPEHLLYRSRLQRNIAYAELSSEFKESTLQFLSIAEIKIKIRSLRTTYNQQVQKILHKSSPDCLYEPSLIWFHEMDRCLKHISLPDRQILSVSTVTTSDPDLNENLSCQLTLLNEATNTANEVAKADPLISHSDDNCDSNTEDYTQITKISSTKPLRKDKRKPIKRRHSKNKTSTDANVAMHTQNIPAEDEFEIFGKYIASQLRKIELEKALRVQLEIQSIISTARICDYE